MQSLAHRLDVGAPIGARQIRQTVDRPLAGATHAGEDLLGEGGRMRPDLAHALEQPRGLARGVEQPIGARNDECALAQRFLVPAQ
ncbi:MAG: hypothetical protein EXR39_16480 [Betaproteobacteria bacterium]|nr:hypothetical protein [Betaproteobacteria bacterium]